MIAEKSIKELENSSVALTVTVTADTIEEGYKAALNKYAASIQLKGFRKGKAPLSVMESKFGKDIREESTFKTIEEELKEVLADVEDKYKPLPYSTPELQDEETLLPFKSNSDITFTVKYDVMPVFEMPAYTGLSVSVPKVELPEEVVTKELDKLRDQNAMVIDKEGAAEKGDIVTIDYVELDEEDNEVAATARMDFIFTIGSGSNFYEIDEDITGMKVGDEKTITKTYAEDSSVEGYAGKTIKLSVALKALKFRDVPALDDDFAQDVKDEYQTVEDLVNATRKKLEDAITAKIEQVKVGALTEELLKGTTISVPESMIELEVDQTWKRYVEQTGLSEEQIMKFLSFQQKTKEDLTAPWRERAEKTLRVQLIMEQIMLREKFTADAEEVQRVVDEQLGSVTDEAQLEYYRNMIEDDLKFQQIAPFLQENNTFTEGEAVDYSEFMQGSIGE
ncbi:MAG: trigger factor [Spirochaetia bacterium]|nr:trigger factor [Spirochaetia bacterium]